MKISESNQSEVIGVDKDTTIDMTIDDSNKKLLMMILSQGLYSDGIGSLIRELTTNALDSQREAGNNIPIKVSLVKESGKFVFSVQDEGVGLSPDRVENVFSKYCSSTKRDSDDQLGFFGLGSKAPLSYTDSFNITSRYEGTEYKYMMFKGEEGTQLSLLDMNDTEEHNGVTIKVALKEEEDYEVFLEKIKRQLAYFEGVFFTTEYDDILNNFKIIKNDIWKYSELNQDRYLHMAMDNVYYSIDFEKLGLEPIAIPIAISLSLKEGIVPTPNREQILYTPQTKALILGKIKSLANFLVNKWNAVAPEAIDLFNAEKLYNSHGTIALWESEPDALGVKKTIEVKLDKKIEKLSDTPMVHVSMPLYPHLPLKRIIETKSSMFQEYSLVGTITPYKYSTKIDEWNKTVNPNHVILLLKEGESLSKNQIEYIKWRGRTYDIIRKVREKKLGRTRPINTGTDSYYGLLELRSKPREDWRIMIEEYCKLVESTMAKWDTIERVEPSQEFLDWKKANRRHATRRNILKEEITIGIARPKENYDRYNKPVFDKAVYKIEELGKLKRGRAGIYIYTTDDRWEDLYPFFQIGQLMHGSGHYTDIDISSSGTKTKVKHDYKYNRINCAILSERNYKKMQKAGPIDNWINVDNVFDKKNRVISDFLALYVTREFKKSKKISNTLENKWFFRLLDNNLYNRIKDIKKVENHEWSNSSLIKDKFISQTLALYIDKGWLNNNMLEPLAYFYKHINDVNFLEYIKIGSQWEYFDSENLLPNAVNRPEVKIAKTLYAKARVANYQTNKLLNLNDFISVLIIRLNPPIKVVKTRNEDDDWDDDREEDDDTDVQVLQDAANLI